MFECAQISELISHGNAMFFTIEFVTHIWFDGYVLSDCIQWKNNYLSTWRNKQYLCPWYKIFEWSGALSRVSIKLTCQTFYIAYSLILLPYYT